MHCFVCVQRGVERPAVALCPHCWVGLCLAHRAEAQQPGPGGLQLGCRHGLLASDARPGAGAQPRPRGGVR